MERLRKFRDRIKITWSKRWTDFDKAPKEIFSEACQIIGDELINLGFTYTKSNKSFRKKSQNNKFIFILKLGTNRYNKKNQSVNLNISFQVISDDLLNFRKEIYLKHPERNFGIPDGLVTVIGFGYLVNNDYLNGSWNLLRTHPKDIANQLIKYALPSFYKFEDIDNLLHSLRTTGQTKEFHFEYLTLDFVMCYGDINIAKDTLLQMLAKRNWTEDFIRLYRDLENNIKLKDSRSLLTTLTVKAYTYGIMIKN